MQMFQWYDFQKVTSIVTTNPVIEGVADGMRVDGVSDGINVGTADGSDVIYKD